MSSVGGFKESAEFFELRAAKAKDDETKTRHRENAEFYRQLAAIVQMSPNGYFIPAAKSPNRWINRAEICRTLAQAFNDVACRRKLMDLAAIYEKRAAQEPG
jgi:hypothetical protein